MRYLLRVEHVFRLHKAEKNHSWKSEGWETLILFQSKPFCQVFHVTRVPPGERMEELLLLQTKLQHPSVHCCSSYKRKALCSFSLNSAESWCPDYLLTAYLFDISLPSVQSPPWTAKTKCQPFVTSTTPLSNSPQWQILCMRLHWFICEFPSKCKKKKKQPW